MTHRGRLGTVMALALVAGVLASPAHANEITRRDPNDERGPLDLARVEVDHVSRQVHAFTITTRSRFSTGDVTLPDGNFAVSFDLNDPNPSDGRWRYEYWAYAYQGRRGMTGSIYDVQAERYVARNLQVSRRSARSVRIQVPLRKLGSPENYRFVAWSYLEGAPCTEANPCVDAVPNRTPLILHDYTDPTVSLTAPARSTDESTTLGFPVSFQVNDERFGAGLDRWFIQSRVAGTTAWVEAASGQASGSLQRVVTGTEGALMETRLVASDRQGNTRRTPIRETLVPYDDTDPASGLTITYGGPGGASDWVAGTSLAGSFLGTTHSTSVVGATAEYSFTGDGFCLLFESTASVSMTIDSVSTTFDECHSGLGSGPHTVELTVDSGLFTLDGVFVTPG